MTPTPLLVARSCLAWALLAGLSAGCGPATTGSADTSSLPETDAGAQADAATVSPDAGAADEDAGAIAPDAEADSPDTGTHPRDAGAAKPDGGAISPDAGAGTDGGCVTTVAPRPGTVLTATGAATGVKAGSTWAWKGLPYAAPPTGSLRFRAPEPAACWAGEFQASGYGPKCPQLEGEPAAVVGDEDCLTLNVWANEGASGAPVLVFVHGGGMVTGTASDILYDGVELAARTGSVVVTVEYRLGALGFLASPELNAESPNAVSGNYGILDQIAALKWVKANIAGFGGDPLRVLLFGESAGGQSVLIHVASPLSKGLFAAAAVESGGVYKTTLSEGMTATRPVIDTVGCGAASDVPACLRGKTAAEFAQIPAASGPLAKGMAYRPVIDGYVLEKNAFDAASAGTHNHVPIILGTNADETSRMVPAVTTDAEYQAAVRAQYPAPAGLATSLLAQYPSSAYASPRKALIALTTDTTWTCPIRRLARALVQHQSEPVYRYYFTWKAPGAAGATVGATHGLELPFVFRSFAYFGASFTPTAADLALSEAFGGYWSRFAAQHDPNGGGAVSWPLYDAVSDPYLAFDTTITSGTGLAKANCDFIDSLLP